MKWSDEQVALLLELWLDGHSTGRITKLMAPIMRSSVIYKVKQLGLTRYVFPPGRHVLGARRVLPDGDGDAN